MILILMGWATEIRRHREQLPAAQEVCTGRGVPHPPLARVGGRRARPPIADSLSFRGPTVFVAPRNLSEKFLATLEMTQRRDPSPAAGSVPHHEWDLGCPILPKGRVGLFCAPSDSPTLIRRGWGTRGVCGISGRRISSAPGGVLCGQVLL